MATRPSPTPDDLNDRTEWFGEPGNDPVDIVDYDPRWPETFAAFATRLREALGPVALRIVHVGSTAVPGLAAKPMIDIQVSVADVADENEYRLAIEALGWPLRVREPNHRFFCPAATEDRTVHVHVCSAGSKWEHDHLLLVAYLSQHPVRADEYATLKRELASRFGDNRLAYTDAKDGFIADTLEMAEHWAGETGWQP